MGVLNGCFGKSFTSRHPLPLPPRAIFLHDTNSPYCNPRGHTTQSPTSSQLHCARTSRMRQNEAQGRFPASSLFGRITLPICARRAPRGVFSVDNQQSGKTPPTGVGDGWVVTGLENKKDTEVIRALA